MTAGHSALSSLSRHRGLRALPGLLPRIEDPPLPRPAGAAPLADAGGP